jgi:hypothetical protein
MMDRIRLHLEIAVLYQRPPKVPLPAGGDYFIGFYRFPLPRQGGVNKMKWIIRIKHRRNTMPKLLNYAGMVTILLFYQAAFEPLSLFRALLK